MNSARSDALVFFGATGDLAQKQIFPALQELVRRERFDLPIVAVGRKKLSPDDLRDRAKKSLAESGVFEAKAFEKLVGLLQYVTVDFDDPASFAPLRKTLGAAKHPLHYVALPPEVFEQVATGLAKAKLADGARLMLEKPFGHDLESAKALSESLHRSFPEEAIFRVDHFLGKESVENIVYVRAANPLLESSLNHERIESIQITMAEVFGVKGRAKFYDSVGAIRDVVQNHLLELVACLTMELPKERGHGALRLQRCRALAQIQTLSPADLVRGQVRGYADEEGVSKGSSTETFAALRLAIDSDRWRGVPIFIRAGKSLPVTATEAIIRWKTLPSAVLEDAKAPPANYVRFRIGPDEVIALGANVKKPGRALGGEQRELVLHRADADDLKPYERLLGDAIEGDATLFADKAGAEESWRVVGPILGNATPAHSYEPASWGPAEAAKIAPEGGWSEPR